MMILSVKNRQVYVAHIPDDLKGSTGKRGDA